MGICFSCMGFRHEEHEEQGSSPMAFPIGKPWHSLSKPDALVAEWWHLTAATLRISVLSASFNITKLNKCAGLPNKSSRRGKPLECWG